MEAWEADSKAQKPGQIKRPVKPARLPDDVPKSHLPGFDRRTREEPNESALKIKGFRYTIGKRGEEERQE